MFDDLLQAMNLPSNIIAVQDGNSLMFSTIKHPLLRLQFMGGNEFKMGFYHCHGPHPLLLLLSLNDVLHFDTAAFAAQVKDLHHKEG